MIKQIVIIGDTHSRSTAIEIIESHLKTAHKIILLGDYTDPYDIISDKKVINHLSKIIKYKKQYPDKFVLLIGNHDMHYVYPDMRCTRYNYKIATDLRDLFEENWKLFDISYQIDKYLFTHAGICSTWLDRHWLVFKSFGLKEDYSNINEVINDIHNSKMFYILHEVGSARSGIFPIISGGITWCDKSEISDISEHLTGFHQYVGHNQVNNIETIGDDDSSITFCDTLGISGEYVVLKI